MSSRGQRLTKSHSMMLSLYGLSGLSFAVLLTFFLVVVVYGFKSFSGLGLQLVFEKGVFVLFNSLLPMLISLPIVLSITFLVVSHSPSRLARPIRLFMYWVGQAPTLLFGFFFFAFFGSTPLSFVLASTALAVAHLSRRWIHLSQKVSLTQVESIKSLGGNVWQILYFLFVKKYFKKFLIHFFAVYFYLFVLVTPFLCIYDGWSGGYLPAVELYNAISTRSDSTLGLALVIVIAHMIRFCLDHLTSFWEVEYG